MESSTAIGMMKIGIMELMMWTAFPVPINNPMVQMTATTATIIGLIISIKRLKKAYISPKMTSIAIGAEIAICTNICTPNVSSATGRPVMKYCSSPVKVAILCLSSE